MNKILLARTKQKFLIILDSFGYISKEEIEAGRRLLRRSLKKKTKIEVLCEAHLPKTSKPSEVRMGKGKGKISSFVCPVVPGKPLYRISGVRQLSAEKAYKDLLVKFSKRLRFVSTTPYHSATSLRFLN